MDRETFKEKRILERQKLLDKIIARFTALDPYAIHLFGSGGTDFRDEFSDIDIWITFEDDRVEAVLRDLTTVFANIAPLLIRHHSRSWSPVGGSANSIIHDTDAGPIVVDYYVSKRSETVLTEDSRLILGRDDLPRGEWRLNRHVDPDMHDSHTRTKDINLLVDLICISIKGIVRKWDDDAFITTLKTVHKAFRKRYPEKLKRRQITLSFKSNYKLLSDLYKIGNKKQRSAILKIRRYAREVERLYT